MRSQQPFRHKPLITQLTHIRSLPRMIPLMYHHRRPLRERLMTVTALVGLLPTVHPLVQRQIALFRKTLVANRAHMRFVARVDAHVVFEVFTAR